METNPTDHSAEHFSADATGNGPRPLQAPMRSSISSLFRNRGGANGFGGADIHPPAAHGGTEDSSVALAEADSGSTINPNIQFLLGQPGARRGGLKSSDASSHSQSALDQQLEREIQAWATEPSPISAAAFTDQLMARHGLTAQELAQRFNQVQRHAFRSREPGAGFENRRQLGLSLNSRTQAALPVENGSSATASAPPMTASPPPPAVLPADETPEPPVRHGEESVDEEWLDERNEQVAEIDEQYFADRDRYRVDVGPFRFWAVLDRDGNVIGLTEHEHEFRQSWLLANSDKLDELAQHYGFENGEELLAAHPELYVMFAQPEGAGRLGPPPAGYAMASAEELAFLDGFLDDDDGIEQIIAEDNEPIPEPSTPAEIAQMNRLGRERYFQAIRYERAQNRVQADYLAERGEAAQNVGGPGWILLSESGIPISDAGFLPNIPFGVPEGYLVRQNADGEWMVFSDAEFSEWYGAQDSPYGRFFASAYGVAEMQFRDLPFGHGYWEPTFNDGQIIIRDGRFISDGLREVDIANLPRLHNADAVWFDPMVGWVTPEQNIKRKTKWYKKVLAVVVIGVLTWATGGAAAGFFAQGSLMAAVAGGAAAGAMSTILSAEMSGQSASFGDVLEGAFIGGVTAFLTFEFSNWSRSLDGTPETAANGANIADQSATFRLRDFLGNSTIKGFTAGLGGGDFEDGFKAGAISYVANYVEGIGDDLNFEGMDKLDRVIQTSFFQVIGTGIRVGHRDGSFAENFAGEYLTNALIDKFSQEVEPADRQAAEERVRERFVNEDGTDAWRNEEEFAFLVGTLAVNPDYTLDDFRAAQQRVDTQNADAQRQASSFSYGNESRAGQFPLGLMAVPAESPSGVSGDVPLTATGGFTDAEQVLIDDIFLSRERITAALPEGIEFSPDRSVSTYDSYYTKIDQLEALRFDTYRDAAANTPVTDADGGRDLYGELELQWQVDLASIGDEQIAADLQVADRNARLNAENAVPVNLTEAQWQTNAEVSDVNALIQLRDNKFDELSQHNDGATVRPDFESVQQELVGEIFALEILIEEESMDVEQALDTEADIATLQIDNNRDAARQDYLMQRAGGDFGAATRLVREVALPGFQTMLANGGETVFGGSDADVEAVLDASDPAAISATLDQHLQELKQSGSDPDQELLIRQNKAYAALTERFAVRSETAAAQGNEPVSAYYANLSLTTAMAFGNNDQFLLSPIENPQSSREFALRGEYIEWRMDLEQTRLQRAQASGDTATAGMAVDSYTQLDILRISNQNSLATWQNDQQIPGLRRRAVEAGEQQVAPQFSSYGSMGLTTPIDPFTIANPEWATGASLLDPNDGRLDFWATNRSGSGVPGDAYNIMVGVAPGDDGVLIARVNGRDDVWTVVFDETRSIEYRGEELSYDAIRVERTDAGGYQVSYDVAGMTIVADFNDQDAALWDAGLQRVDLRNAERSYLQSMQGVSPMEVNNQLLALDLQPLPMTNQPVQSNSGSEIDGLVIDPEQDLLIAAQDLQVANRAVMDFPDDPTLRTVQRTAQLEYQQQYWHLQTVQRRAGIDGINRELSTLDSSDAARINELTEMRSIQEQDLRFVTAQRGNAELQLLILREGGNTADGSRAQAFHESPEAFAAPMVDNFYLDPSTAAIEINSRDDALGYVLTTLHISRETYDATPVDEQRSLNNLADQIFETGGRGAQVQVMPVIYQSDTGIDSTLVYSVTGANGEHHIVDVDGSRFDSETDYRENNRTMNAVGDIRSVMPAGGEVVYDDAGRLILSAGDARIEGSFEQFRRESKLDYIVAGAGVVALGMLTYGTGWVAMAGTGIGLTGAGYGAGTSGYNLLDAGRHGRSLNITDPEARLNYLTLAATAIPIGAKLSFAKPGVGMERTMVTAAVAGGAASVESTYRIMTNWENMTGAEQREAIAQMSIGFVPMMFAPTFRTGGPGRMPPDSLLTTVSTGGVATLATYFGGPIGTSLVLGSSWTVRGATGTLGATFGNKHFLARVPGVNAQTYLGANAGPHAVNALNDLQVGNPGYSNAFLLVGDSLLGSANLRASHGYIGPGRPAASVRLNNGLTGVGFTSTGLGAGTAGLRTLSDPSFTVEFASGGLLTMIGGAALTKASFDTYHFLRPNRIVDGSVAARFPVDTSSSRFDGFIGRAGGNAAKALPPLLGIYGAYSLVQGVNGFTNSAFYNQTPITEDARFGLYGNTVPSDGVVPFQLPPNDGVAGALPPFELTNTSLAQLPSTQSDDFGAAGTLLPDFGLDADSPGIQRTGMRPVDSGEFVVVGPGDTLWSISEDGAGFLLTEDERHSFGANADAQTLEGLNELMAINPQEGFDPSLIDGNASFEPGDPDLILPGTELKVQAPPDPIDFPDPREVLDQSEN